MPPSRAAVTVASKRVTVSAPTRRGIRRRGAVLAEGLGSGDLPDEGAAEGDPKRIAVRGAEGFSTIPAGLALFRESANVLRKDGFLLQACDDLLGGVRGDRDEEGPLAERA